MTSNKTQTGDKKMETTTKTIIELTSRTRNVPCLYMVVDKHPCSGAAETLMGIREIYTVRGFGDQPRKPRILTVFNDGHVTVMNQAGRTSVMDWEGTYEKEIYCAK
jgi:hypothetical protein